MGMLEDRYDGAYIESRLTRLIEILSDNECGDARCSMAHREEIVEVLDLALDVLRDRDATICRLVDQLREALDGLRFREEQIDDLVAEIEDMERASD